MKPLTLLIVDESAAVRQEVEGIVSTPERRVLQSASGAAALSVARAELPELVIMDARMGGGEGEEVCRLLRANGATKDIPILLFSNATDAAGRPDALGCGADDFLSKPFDRADFGGRVGALLRWSQHTPHFRAPD